MNGQKIDLVQTCKLPCITLAFISTRKKVAEFFRRVAQKVATVVIA